MSTLAIDIGSSRIKAIHAAGDGQAVEFRSVRTPQRAIEAGERAYPASQVYAAIEELIADRSQALPSDPIDTLAFSCLGTAMVPVDPAGRPLGAALAPADARPSTQPGLDELLGLPDGELFRRTGSDPRVSSSLQHCLWWQRTHPEVMGRIHRFRSLRGFALQQLCDADAEDPTWASRSMLLDLETNEWSPTILAAAGLGTDLLPELHPASSTWPVRRAARESLGLANDAVAVLGALDSCCAVFGSNDAGPPGLVNIVGTYEHIAGDVALEQAFEVAEASGAIVHSYLRPGRYLAMTRTPLGDLLKQIAAAAPDALDDLLDGIATSPEGLELTLTEEAVQAELDGGTSPRRVLQAVLESAAGVLKRFADAWLSRGGPAERIAAVGGGANHEAVLQLKANVLGRPLSTLASDECAGLGALRLAAVATRGLSAAEACERFPNPTLRTYQPQPTGAMA